MVPEFTEAENTIEAYAAAMDLGADAVEADVCVIGAGASGVSDSAAASAWIAS